VAQGSGTDKQAIVVDTINLNNMLNKAVFGTVDVVTNVANFVSGKTNSDESTTDKNWQASFACLGINNKPTVSNDDVQLAVSMLQTMLSAATTNNKNKKMGLGLYFCPYSTQSILQQYSAGQVTLEQLQQSLLDAGVSLETQQAYQPLWDWVASCDPNRLDLIALAPEVADIAAVRSQGIPGVNAERRAQYVVDAPGFIALTQNPKFKLYTDRSLLKDFTALSTTTDKKEAPEDSGAFNNYFAERILVHEAGATALARYAMMQSTTNSKDGASFVTMLAPTADVRFLGGINGRLPRICQALVPNCGVTDNAVTTFLLNPTAAGTLSQTRYLRLEIGTGPETLAYQTKVADYLWFSANQMPAVNLIPRLMN